MAARIQLHLIDADRDDLEAFAMTARREQWAERLMDRDTTLWSEKPDVQAAIADRLGWLDSPDHFTEQIPALEAFGDATRAAGFTTAVVMGMGGSSLAPDMLHQTFGVADGYLDLRILDSTDPAAVAATVDDLDPLSTLWIVASKSGTTTEPLAFLADAWARVEAALELAGSHQRPGEFFAAITDPGKSVNAIPHHDELRELFLNPADIGGRYSALSYVGLVPASLIGLDLDALLASATSMLGACREPDPDLNPGLLLGLAMGSLARNGRDKLTIVADPDLASFGAWAEQLIAESTGKHGVGIVPVDREPLGPVEVYGEDRVFVSLELAGARDPFDGRLAKLHEAGHPVIRIEVEDPMDLGGEFVRWEVATAIAGAVLGIDPFDQPNVEEAKELTRQVLAKASGGGGAAATSDGPPIHDLDGLSPADVASLIRDSMGVDHPGRYLTIQAFIAPSDAADAAFDRLRVVMRDATHHATTAGYGPRFLHSTGQLHKGGAPIGWFLQLVSTHPDDREIPGWPYTFGRLIDAQAQGDAAAIASHDLPILRLRLGADHGHDLRTIERALDHLKP